MPCRQQVAMLRIYRSKRCSGDSFRGKFLKENLSGLFFFKKKREENDNVKRAKKKTNFIKILKEIKGEKKTKNNFT